MSSFFIPFIGNSTGGGGTTDAYTKTETNTLLAGKADIVDGKVPASQLPSYVLEYDSASSFPGGGESGKIYVAADTNKTYRWGGSTYVEISESLALGETASTAYPGNKGKANADAIGKKPGEITTGKQYTIDGQTITAGEGAEAFNDLASNKASGMFSHAEGQGTTASGNQSHAEGGGTTALGAQSHAEGAGTIASGTHSHAEGGGSTASGAISHAEGAGTIASGFNSHSEGGGTKASSANQHVQGRYNVEDTNDTYAFIIGNGTGDNARHNAFAIDWNGLIYVNGAATGVDVSAFPSPTDINTAITKANAAAPQSTTYTKTEVNAALSEKLNTADVDAAFSSTSTNPVQNKVIQGSLARLVNAGAKNLVKPPKSSDTISGVTATINVDGSITLNGTCTASTFQTYIFGMPLLPAGSYRLSGCPSGGSSSTFELSCGGGGLSKTTDFGNGATFTLSAETQLTYIQIVARPGAVFDNTIFYPMICTAENYAISPAFAPYVPTNRELYEMILALQN